MLYKLLLLLFFPSFSIIFAQVNSDKNCFTGEITYEIFKDFIGDAPPMLAEIEGVTTKKIFIISKDSLFVVSLKGLDTISIQLSTLTSNLVYDFRVNKTTDYSLIRKQSDASKTKRRKSKEKPKKINEFNCILYDEHSVAGLTQKWITKDFPLFFEVYQRSKNIKNSSSSMFTNIDAPYSYLRTSKH